MRYGRQIVAGALILAMMAGMTGCAKKEDSILSDNVEEEVVQEETEKAKAAPSADRSEPQKRRPSM